MSDSVDLVRHRLGISIQPCQTCKFYRYGTPDTKRSDSRSYGDVRWCAHPSSFTDYVITGVKWCATARGVRTLPATWAGNNCGPEGLYWEPIDE